MNRKEAKLTHSKLTDILVLGEDGRFRWKVRAGKMLPGTIAGSLIKSSGLRVICIAGDNFYAHRLAWFYDKKKWPEHEVAHKDGDGDNNTPTNLVDAEHSVIVQNRNSAKSGSIGVRRNKSGGVIARINADKKAYYLGTFSTVVEAQTAYLEAKKIHHRSLE